MKISNIKIKNFKNFNDLSLDLNNINVFIGQCSSGKSNLFEVFQFLKDISSDFKKAILKHGGSYIQNINSQNEPTYIKISFDNNLSDGLSFGLENYELDIIEDKNFKLDFNEISYEILFNLNDFNYEIITECLEYTFDACLFKDSEKNSFSDIINNKLIIKNENGNFNAKLSNEDLFKLDDLIPKSLLNMCKKNFLEHNIPLINSPLVTTPIPCFLLFEGLKFYDFIPKFCKNISEQNSEINLLQFGENLAISLNYILKNKNNKRKFINLLKELLPDIENVDVNLIQDMYVLSIIEKFSEFDLPSPLVSDGSSNIIALIVALYFEKSNAIFIEEPERNIHPSLFLSIVDMLKEASSKKQIFITTHSPEILKNMDLKNIYFISKNEKGYSNISKPINNKDLQPLIADLGIDEIFVDNYLNID